MRGISPEKKPGQRPISLRRLLGVPGYQILEVTPKHNSGLFCIGVARDSLGARRVRQKES